MVADIKQNIVFYFNPCGGMGGYPELHRDIFFVLDNFLS